MAFRGTESVIKRAAFAEMGIGRYGALAMFLVVVSFSTALMMSQWRVQPIEELALDIIQDAAPSIEHLSAAHAELTRLGTSVNEYVTRAENRVMTLGNDIKATRRRLETALNGYRALPSSRAESRQLNEIDHNLTLLDQATNIALEAADATTLARARSVLKPFGERLTPGRRIHRQSEIRKYHSR